mmetsp:Transcript_21333/g.75175  ORF Transcript_21333/g.75175 Transcript_21333/m.75175 type:complete len:604 (-) Transcript_21333:508-2319(-)
MAARPGSRGGMPPGAVVRPGTGSRGAYGAAPGSARLGTGRLGTGQAAPVYSGVGLATDVQISDRPVTQQGMVGMRLKSAGPGRQVQDMSYFMGLLRSKNSELTKEITKLKEEVEKFHKDNNAYQVYERKYEGLIKEVRSLEGELADHNLAMDKARAGTDPGEIEHYHMGLKAKNEAEAKQVDSVFMERQERDQATARVEEQIARVMDEAAAKMNSLPPEKQARYHQLRDENRALGEQIGARQRELEELNASIHDLEEQLRRDPWRDEYSRLEKAHARVSKELAAAREEAAEASLDPAEARERLLRKVKDDTASMQRVDREVEEVKDEVRRLEKTAADLATDMEERKGEAGESHKYEVLYQRDQEMSEFIERFPETRKKEMEAKESIEQINVRLLEHMSKGLERQHHLPSRAHHAEMQEDLSFKERAIESSASTQARLEQDLAKRRAELDKINTLDSKISVELTSLREKMRTMSDEMEEFGNIESLKVRAEETKRMLAAKKSEYMRRRDMIRTQVAQLSAQYDRKKAALEENETSKALSSLEQKLKHYEQSIFSLKEYIETKGKESDYKSLAESCMKLTDDLNAHIIRAQAAITPMAAATAAPY